MRFLILAAALLAAGCDAATFASANQALVSTKQATAQAATVPLPAAAIAAGLGAIELVNALSTTSQASAVPAKGTGLNLFQLAAVATGDQDVVNADAKVNMHLRYTSSTAADGSYTAAVTSFTGTAQGYNVDAHGDFSFDPAGKVSCQMAGTIGYNGTTFAVKDLQVSASYPLPTANARLGSCVFQQLDGDTVKAELKANMAVDAKGAIAITGDLTQDGTTTPLTNFGQASFVTAGS
jgi:hypothetical protein